MVSLKIEISMIFYKQDNGIVIDFYKTREYIMKEPL